MLSQKYIGHYSSVIWQGYSVEDNSVYRDFISNELRERLNDESGQREIENHLRGLASTGFERENLEKLLNARPTEEKDWAIGEAFAEAILEKENNAKFPWNQRRDLRNENSILSGADLIGLIDDNGQAKLLIGEVKTSQEKKYPPQVMYGAKGMIEQLKAYHLNYTREMTLVSWLLVRCKNTPFENKFNEAIKFFITNGNSGLYLVGILIRISVDVDELDLKNRAETLDETLDGQNRGELQAYYLPHTIDEFVNLAIGGDQNVK